jgi:O-antigen/teichoic acid export membrane protein
VDSFKTLVVIVLLAILFSLGKALFHLTSGKGDPNKTVRALTWRIGLSVALLLCMLMAAHLGWITPHGVGR